MFIIISFLKDAVSQELYINTSRIPKIFIPTHYNLTLQIDIAEKVFIGKTDITFKVNNLAAVSINLLQFILKLINV